MQNCEQCGAKKWFSKLNKKTGLQEKHHIKQADGIEYDLRVWRCWRCGNVQDEVMPFIPLHYRTTASILYIDLEVSKSLMFNYGLRVPSGYINPEDLYRDFFIICCSVSYVGSDVIWRGCGTPQEA